MGNEALAAEQSSPPISLPQQRSNTVAGGKNVPIRAHAAAAALRGALGLVLLRGSEFAARRALLVLEAQLTEATCVSLVRCFGGEIAGPRRSSRRRRRPRAHRHERAIAADALREQITTDLTRPSRATN